MPYPIQINLQKVQNCQIVVRIPSSVWTMRVTQKTQPWTYTSSLAFLQESFLEQPTFSGGGKLYRSRLILGSEVVRNGTKASRIIASIGH